MIKNTAIRLNVWPGPSFRHLAHLVKRIATQCKSNRMPDLRQEDQVVVVGSKCGKGPRWQIYVLHASDDVVGSTITSSLGSRRE
jgi:hypothetical protein